jgi:hypothetical protein
LTADLRCELVGPSASRNGWIDLRVVGAESISDRFSRSRLVARSIAIRVGRSFGVLARILPDDDCKHAVNDSDEDTESRAEPFTTHPFLDNEWNAAADVFLTPNRPANSISRRSLTSVRRGPHVTFQKGRGSELVGSRGLETPSIRMQSGQESSIRRRVPSHTVQSGLCGEVAPRPDEVRPPPPPSPPAFHADFIPSDAARSTGVLLRIVTTGGSSRAA